MTTNAPLIIADDDGEDQFDWEAAVKEIDVACQGASTTTPASNFISHSNPRKPSVSRQSTLDRFIQNHHQPLLNPLHNQASSARKDASIGDGDLNHNDNDDNIGVCYCKIDLEASKTWIYPDNLPRRDYQFSITKTALFSNTLVALPTGLGKTFIAAVVMYNYFRWFPEGKIVFSAPSRPLVMQQIEACHNIVGIPQEWAIDLTGQTSPSRRAALWKSKRVFFVTPQVLEKDIQSGTCLTKHLVCLVIDEAHKAVGNYAYCVTIRELMAVPLQFRILALTATPGSKRESIQKVIDNLQISKLEYRNESDPDVSPYVHSRDLQLITVGMGKDGTEIYATLLDAIRPFVAKLSSFGILRNRDAQTLSPFDFISTRDNFRQEPPLDLSELNRGEAEVCFTALITLYHIRKLLSSHGIRPAYEMLEDKMQNGSLRRHSRNETILKTKFLMQQNLSHGAPNPKLLKMIEILVDHFKRNDPKNSRVIIFSHFRESVRDIMNSLSSIGDSVKATEFIGQSSGKTLKGQTQKRQQAVLQKFRAGGYNIIVATSIGEEGLDIMEVDLVICFDANVSHLRMIQRMGRTGRKHDGRVVVLAFEGSEEKGYFRKKANSKVVKGHMHNGGVNSFDFHASPRMIPHICKPDVQFVEFSIEQFVPRGKKVKDDSLNDCRVKEKLSDAEAELISKYFRSSGGYSWKPSLIAFPHFQAFPSRVHNVVHSGRTKMLIGTMQHLQALSFSVDIKDVTVEIRNTTSLYQCLGDESLARNEEREKDLLSFHDCPRALSEKKISDERHVSVNQNLPMHCFLFGSAYVSVIDFGKVSITSVPSLPFVKEVPFCMSKAEIDTELLSVVKPKSSPSTPPAEDNVELTTRSKVTLSIPAEPTDIYNSFAVSSWSCNSNAHEKAVLHEHDNFATMPSPARSINYEVIVVETPVCKIKNIQISPINCSTNDVNDTEMSPRLTNMVEEGVVPESPLGEIGGRSSNAQTVCRNSSSDCVSLGIVPNYSRKVSGTDIPNDSVLPLAELPNTEMSRESLSPVHALVAFCSGLPLNDPSTKEKENVQDCCRAGALGYNSASPINIDSRTGMYNCVNARGNISGSPVNVETRTPLVNLTNSCSNDWHLSSEEPSTSVQQAPKFKRLRKHEESTKRISSKKMKENLTSPISQPIRSGTRPNPGKHIRGKPKMVSHAKAFIEEEAEVSSDTEVSDDEEEDNDSNSNDDSFIDDRINPTIESSQAEAIRSNMMAVYRRSLLSQSPMERPLCYSTDLSPSSAQCITETDETGSCSSGKTSHTLQTPQTGLNSVNQSAMRSSRFCQMKSGDIPRVYIPSETSGAPGEERKLESRKRKLSFHQVVNDPENSLEPQLLFDREATEETSMHCQPENNNNNVDVFYDDRFYEGLDLDALEAQATKLLRCKSELSIDRKRWVTPAPLTKKILEVSHSPSFDLGI